LGGFANEEEIIDWASELELIEIGTLNIRYRNKKIVLSIASFEQNAKINPIGANRFSSIGVTNDKIEICPYSDS